MQVRLVVALLLWLGAMGAAHAQAPQDFAEFEGQYEYRDGQTLFMLARDAGLVAIIDDTPYLLQPVGPDVFTNPPGDRVPFLRGADGRITAFQEAGDTFDRLSRRVPPRIRQVLEPRPLRRDGTAAPYHYAPPRNLNDGINTGAAGAGTLPRDVAEQLVNGVIAGDYPNVRSLLVYHRGALVLEEYFYGFDRDRPHQMRSFTKSVVSLLVGAASDRGLLRPEEPAFPLLGYESYANPDPRKDRITVLDLLSNRSGLDCNEYDDASLGHETRLFETSDWVKAFVDLPMIADPGTTARYCSGGFFTSSRIVERAVGEPLQDFAQEALFGPLGIRRTDWRWPLALDVSGRSEFGQIHLRPRDMLKLGILIQQRGEWQGRRVLSASWIDAAIGPQTRVDDSEYGLGIWHRWFGLETPTGPGRVDTIMLSGNGGQKVFLVPALDLILVTTGVAFFAEAPANAMLARVIVPALMQPEAPAP